MKLVTPLHFKQVNAKEVHVSRVVPGNRSNPKLILQNVSVVKFNSKFTAAKPRILGNFFLRPKELTFIADYCNACIECKKIL